LKKFSLTFVKAGHGQIEHRERMNEKPLIDAGADWIIYFWREVV
jgi:hypothetical protein